MWKLNVEGSIYCDVINSFVSRGVKVTIFFLNGIIIIFNSTFKKKILIYAWKLYNLTVLNFVKLLQRRGKHEYLYFLLNKLYKNSNWNIC